MTPDSDLAKQLMWLALTEARNALVHGEIPIGAVVAGVGGESYEVLGRGYNRNIELRRRIAHAEIVALNDASDRLMARADGRPLPAHVVPLDQPGIVLVSTLEPCIMCYSAAIVTGVDKVVYGLQSPADAGPGRVSMITKPDAREPSVVEGVFANESRELFCEWLVEDKGKRHRAFVEQLLAFTAAS